MQFLGNYFSVRMKAKGALSSLSSCHSSSSLVISFLSSRRNTLKGQNLLQPEFVSADLTAIQIGKLKCLSLFRPRPGPTFIEQLLCAQHYADGSHPQHLIKCTGIDKEWADFCPLCAREGGGRGKVFDSLRRFEPDPATFLYLPRLAFLIAPSCEVVKTVSSAISPSSQNSTFPHSVYSCRDSLSK